MDAQSNPLILARKQAVTRDLDGYCHWLNTLGWVRAAGHPYSVAERVGPSGAVERFLTR